MSTASASTGLFARYPAAALGLYGVVVVACAAIVWVSIADLIAQRAALAASVDVLDRLEAHRGSPDAATAAPGAMPSGSPFLGGDTITVAGAELLQRVAGAITRFGGSVQSSQVDLQSAQAKGEFVTLIVSCEIDEPSLQKLLYDIEAGMPYLFVDQLNVQAAQAVANNGRMTLLMAVSGRWSEKK